MKCEGDDVVPFGTPGSEDIWNWWKNVLKSPKHVVAPMVDASELPWRLLSRRYNSHLCYTPMIHSKNFVRDLKYRNDYLNPCKCLEDRPLIMQFCGNDPKILTEAAALAKGYCDGVDINLGCPQKIAKTGRYGAFLQNEWDLIACIVRSINTNVGIPVSCKIRVFEDIERTVSYARMIESAGCWMLTVHGRTITQKGPMTGLANWNYIKAVKEALSIPVLANGNIQYLTDVEKCIEFTGVNGVMSAEGNLHNPAIFAGKQPPVWEIALEYIQLIKEFPCQISYTRGHLFKLFQHLLAMEENFDLRGMLGKGKSLECFEDITLALKQRFEPYFLGIKDWTPPDNHLLLKLPFPPWLCQPYERPPPTLTTPMSKVDKKFTGVDLEDRSTHPKSSSQNFVSRKQLKRMKTKTAVNPRIRNNPKLVLCSSPDCFNVCGSRCEFKLCKVCCNVKCNKDTLDCIGHRRFVKTIFERHRQREASQMRVAESMVTSQ